MSESTNVTKKRKRESTIIYGRPQNFFQGGNDVDILFQFSFFQIADDQCYL